MKTLASIIVLCLLSGCSLTRRIPRIVTPQATVTAAPDAGKPATLNTNHAGETLPIPAGTAIRRTEIAAQPSQPATANTPFVPAQPAKVVIEFAPAEATTWTRTAETVTADTGTVDTSVRQAEIAAAESRILLFAALAALVVAGVFFWLQFPTAALMAAAASVVLFLAWKVSGLPSWFWALAVLLGGGAVGIYFGFNRAEKNSTPST